MVQHILLSSVAWIGPELKERKFRLIRARNAGSEGKSKKVNLIFALYRGSTIYRCYYEQQGTTFSPLFFVPLLSENIN